MSRYRTRRTTILRQCSALMQMTTTCGPKPQLALASAERSSGLPTTQKTSACFSPCGNATSLTTRRHHRCFVGYRVTHVGPSGSTRAGLLTPERAAAAAAAAVGWWPVPVLLAPRPSAARQTEAERIVAREAAAAAKRAAGDAAAARAAAVNSPKRRKTGSRRGRFILPEDGQTAAPKAPPRPPR